MAESGTRISSFEDLEVFQYCLDLNYIDDATSQRWRGEYVAVAKMLQVIYTRWSSP